MNSSRKVGWLTMGCQSIFMLDGDLLIPRAPDTPFTNEVKGRYHNSASSFLNVVDSYSLR